MSSFFIRSKWGLADSLVVIFLIGILAGVLMLFGAIWVDWRWCPTGIITIAFSLWGAEIFAGVSKNIRSEA